MARLDHTDRKQLGERLRVSRTRLRLTQEQAANHLKVARTTIVAIEQGERQIRADELAALSTLYGVSVNSLLRDSALHVELAPQFRRAAPSTRDEDDGAAALALLHRLATSYVELEQRLNKPLRTNYPQERPLGRGNLTQQADDLALEVRTALGVGLAPIPDIVGLIELELGVRVFIRPLAPKIAGVFAYHPTLGACILLNANHPKGRRAWTMAHELAHFLTNRREPDVCFTTDGRIKPPSERFADLFAPALLMPGVALRRAFNELTDQEGRFSLRQLLLLAHRFYTSTEAMCRRLEDLELLARGTFEMIKDRGIAGEPIREALGESDQTASTAAPAPRLALLAAEAYGKGLLSEGQLVDMLAMERIEVRRLIDALAGAECDDLGGLRA